MTTFSSGVIIDSVVPTMNKFCVMAAFLGKYASAIYHSVAGITPLDGYSYGRYFDSGNPLLQFETFNGSIDDMIAQGCVLREALGTSLTALMATARSDDLSQLPAAVYASYDALVACSARPWDSIVACMGLAAFAPPPLNSGGDTIGQEMDSLAAMTAITIRVAALVNLARATSLYVPTSSSDALDLRNRVCAQFDNEINRLALIYDDADVGALTVLRGAVAADMNARGLTLQPVVSMTFMTNLPSLTLAFKLYRDDAPALEPDLVARNDVQCAGFMPLVVEALGSAG